MFNNGGEGDRPVRCLSSGRLWGSRRQKCQTHRRQAYGEAPFLLFGAFVNMVEDIRNCLGAEDSGNSLVGVRGLARPKVGVYALKEDLTRKIFG